MRMQHCRELLLYSESGYPEYESFEKYVPKGWKGKYQYFNDIIPAEYRYWEDQTV